MNTANAIPFGAPPAIPFANRRHPVALDPVRVRFDAFELDEPNALLLRDGKVVTLQPKPLAVLCALARTPGRLLTKNELLDMIWGHRYVTNASLKSAISELRAALDDDARQPRYIQTVSRRGYRFIAAPAGLPMQTASASERKDTYVPAQPGLAVLTALCRADAALAELIRTVAAAL
jgi:DNA-binding winged helix-turn-helix (wHTH) protein